MGGNYSLKLKHSNKLHQSMTQTMTSLKLGGTGSTTVGAYLWLVWSKFDFCWNCVNDMKSYNDTMSIERKL